jgi:hypothetical protein
MQSNMNLRARAEIVASLYVSLDALCGRCAHAVFRISHTDSYINCLFSTRVVPTGDDE